MGLAGLFAVLTGGCRKGPLDVPEARADRGEAPARAKAGALAAVAHDRLCVTRGHVAVDGGRARVDHPTTRAVAPGSSGEAAALRFTYLGPTEETSRLASGQIRHQVGLKLRAADGCNVVYVMWRLDARPFVEVSVKRNPGLHTHAECGAGGYTKVKPSASAPPPALAAGDAHVIAAAIDGDTLTATIDDAVVWTGTLTDGARDLDGPAGFRSDNLALEIELRAAPGAAHDTPCGDGGGDD